MRFRLAGQLLLLAFVVVGATGYFGVKSGSSRAEGGGLELEVTHGLVSRPGLATPLQIEVRRPGGFDQPVRIALTQGYLDLFDLNQIDPAPASEWSDGDRVVWEFEPPTGEQLTVRFDARIEPARAAPASATVAVLDEDGDAQVSTDIRTVLFP